MHSFHHLTGEHRATHGCKPALHKSRLAGFPSQAKSHRENYEQTTILLQRPWPFSYPAPSILWRDWFTPTSKNGAAKILQSCLAGKRLCKESPWWLSLPQFLGEKARDLLLQPRRVGRWRVTSAGRVCNHITARDKVSARARAKKIKITSARIDISGIVSSYSDQCRALCSSMEQYDDVLSWLEMQAGRAR